MADFQIVELTDAQHEEEWNAYVSSVRNPSICHALEWREILHRTFGHRSWYLMAKDHGTTCGVLPLVEMESSLFGHFFVSLPFLDYGGILADAPECESALATAAADLARRRGARHIELRQSFAATSETVTDWQLQQHRASLVVTLNADPDVQWSRLSSRLRGKIRKAEKSGARFSVAGPEALDEFYRVFALNMRDLGTPVYSRALFQNIMRYFKDATILLVHLAGRPVAGALVLRGAKKLELPWICSDYSQSSCYVNEFLYWNAILWAQSSGSLEIDLGRSSADSGTHRFKMQWNPEVRPLFWYYWLASGAQLPELNPANPKYAFAIRCWKKMPVALANRIGPLIVRNIP